MGRRALWIVVLLVAWMLAIIVRLAWLQVARHEYYAGKARQNHQRGGALLASRGTIVDRGGRELAISLLTDSIFADQNQLKTDSDRRKAAELLSPLLGLGQSDLLKQLTGTDGFVWLKRQLEPDQSQAILAAIEQHKLSGIAIKQEPRRFYPNDTLAAHLIGYVGAEDKGQAGIEQKHDESLRGAPGQIKWETDAAGRAFNRSVTPPSNGAQVITTIDSTLQHKVEVLLDEAVRMTRAKGASAVVIDPATGEILALANIPTFSPNERPRNAGDKVRANRAITLPYEPGSVFKTVTYAAAIEEGLVKPDDKVNCGNGEVTLGKRVIHDTHAYGVLTVEDAFAKSSNVCAIRIAQKLGKERFFDYIGRFGFGRKTGIELPGESRGIVNPLDAWRPDSIGSVAIGQEVSVTLLQAVAVMGAIANRGVWVKPHVVKQIVTPSGRMLYEARPETRQVMREETARTMTRLLERVVTLGTARAAINLNGYTAAGKTGTPQKADGKHGYRSGKFMPTFAGFVPATNPRFAIIVMIDEPIGLHQGGSVAAPVFNLIAEAALGDYAVQPDDKQFRESLVALSKKYESAPREEIEAPMAEIEIVKAGAEPAPEAKSEKEKSEERASAGRGDVKVSANLPKSPAKSPAKSLAKPPLPAPPAAPAVFVETFIMPDFRGRGARAVMQACAQLRLNVRMFGSGVAVRQFPAAGARVKAGDPCKVDLE